MPETLVVPAEESDLREIVQRRWADSPSRQLYYDLAAASPNGAWAAKDEGTVVGIAVARALDTEWYLSDLFVEPSFRRQGLGSRLLAEVARDAGDVARSGFLDPRELAGVTFFARRGVPAHTAVLEMAGRIPREEELLAMAAGEHRFRTEPIEPLRHRYGLDALDRELRTSARPQDHVLFADRASGSAFFIHDELVGYAYVWPHGRIGPLATVSPSYCVPFLAFAMMALVRQHAASWCSALVPATNVRVTRAMLRTGLQVGAVKLFASDAGGADLSRYCGFHELLF